MYTLKPGYQTATKQVKTASGAPSTARSIEPGAAVVADEDGVETRVVDAVTQYVLQDSAEKAAKAAKETNAAVIRAYTGTVRDENALAGNYQKTLRVLGSQVKHVQYAVDAAHMDAYSVSKEKDDIDAIRIQMGTAFESVFEETISLSIKKSVMENDTLRKELSQELVKALGVAGIKKYFEKDTVWKVKKGMAETQYTLEPAVREALRTGAKQNADSIKDASGPALS